MRLFERISARLGEAIANIAAAIDHAALCEIGLDFTTTAIRQAYAAAHLLDEAEARARAAERAAARNANVALLSTGLLMIAAEAAALGLLL